MNNSNIIEVYWLAIEDDYRTEDIKASAREHFPEFSDKSKIDYLINNTKSINLRKKPLLLPNQFDVLIVDDEIKPIIDLCFSLGDLIYGDFPQKGKTYSVGVCQETKIFGHFFDVVRQNEKVTAPKVVTLDFYFKETNETEISTKVDISPTKQLFEKITDSPIWNDTIFIGISNYAWKDISDELRELMYKRGVFTYDKSDELYNILPQIFRNILEIEYQQRIKSNAMQEIFNNAKRSHEFTSKEIFKVADSAGIIGKSDTIEKIIKLSLKIASSEARVLLRGESGVGKELFARLIHQNSPRKHEKFMGKNIAAIAEDKIELELFGYQGETFANAKKEDQPGLFWVVGKGTLLLDEIGDASPNLQAKLLRAIQEREFTLQGPSQIPLEFKGRLICATNRDLEKMCQEKSFREDLYYRINVVDIEIPPLRAHREDIPLLANHFIEKISQKNGGLYSHHKLLSSAEEVLEKYHWPGNVRELESMIERTLIKVGPERRQIAPTDIEFREAHEQKVHPKSDDRKDTLTNEDEANCPRATIKEKSWFSELDLGEINKLCREIWETEGRIIWDKKRKRNYPDIIPEVIEAEVRHDQFGFYIRAVLAIFWCFFEESEKPPEVTKQKFYDIFGFKDGGNFRGYLKNKSTTKSASMFFPIMREHVKGYGPPDLYLDGMLLKQNGIVLDIG